VLRIDPDGALTAASAGHLAPYIDGRENQLECGLPLGLAAGAHYSEVRVQLQPAARLTLATDGVVEARNAAGELFGFDRTAAISGQSADQIAKTAELFGQDDDITVLTLTFAPAEVLHG
jgi:serine phosphatase RsbU (regulator of sigma subunit)